MIDSKYVYQYLIAIGVIMTISYFGNKVRQAFSTEDADEYELIKKYLLNDSPLYGYNKPKIWIHSKYEVNARKWRDFYSRNTTDLNQPYIHLTIKTIINYCGNDFHICLIDDDTFSKLIPSWDVDLTNMAEPMKSQVREVGLLQLVYYYGGMLVPNSFLCKRNLITLYRDGVANGKPFVSETLNRSNIAKDGKRLSFVPDTYIMGAEKNNECVKELCEYIKKIGVNGFFTGEHTFKGDISKQCMKLMEDDKLNLVDGKLVGIKTPSKKPILLEDLLSEDYLSLDKNAYGIYIPEDEILHRNKYQWFAVLSSEEILDSRLAIAKYLKVSIVDNANEYYKDSKIRSVVSI